jgi:PAS domain S-box-containing protein
MISIQVNPRRVAHLNTLSRVCGIVTAGIGCLVIVGWLFNVPALKTVIPGYTSMKFNTALSFILSGLTLSHLHTQKGKWLKQISACIVLLLASLTACQYLFGWNLGIDQLFVIDNDPTTTSPGRFSLMTAVSFFCAGISLLLFVQKRFIWIAQLFAAFMVAHAFLTLTGYVFGVSSLYRIGMYSTIALHTAICLFMLALGLLTARPAEGIMATFTNDTAGGMMARRMIPFAVLIPLLLNWMEVAGRDYLRIYDFRFESALFVLSNIIILVGIVYFSARFLSHVDTERWQAEEKVRQARVTLEQEVQARTAELVQTNERLKQEIQERKRIETTLEENQFFLSKILNMTPDLVYIFDITERRTIFHNRDLSELLGYTSEQFTAIDGEFIQNLMHPDDFDRVIIQRENFFTENADNTVLENEYRLKAADGTWRWFYSHDMLFARKPDGSPWQMIGTARDITQRKNAEQLIQTSEERFRTLVTHSNVGIFQLDTEGRCLYVNDHYTEITGLSAEAAYGMGWVAAMHPDELSRVVTAWHKAAEDGTSFNMEFRYQKANGAVVWVDCRAGALRDSSGSIQGWFGSVMDITERKRAEQNLIESELKFRQLAENLEEVFWLADSTTYQSIYLSPSFENVWGIPPEYALEHPEALIEYIHPEDRAANIEAQQKLATEGGFNFEFRIIRPDGQIRWLWSRAFPVYNDQGVHYRFVGITQDITERKEAEQHRLQLEIERGKVAMLAEFIADTSHDLRTPLTIMNTTLYLLDKGTQEEKQKERLAVIQKQVNHMDKLISELHDMVLIDQITSFDTALIPVHRLVRDAGSNITRDADEKNIHIHLEIEPDLSPLRGEEHYLQVALKHLLENAVNYTAHGGTIIIRAFSQDESIVIEVHDSGEGIAPDDLPHIFDRYYKANRARTKNGTGFGVGLTMAQKIVEGHHGSISVMSTPDVGSIFRIMIPAESVAVS